MRKELQKKLNKVLFLLIVFFSINTFCQNFRTVWRTTAPNESITIPTFGGGYNYTVDWGDGNSDAAQNGDATHTYAAAGDYTVTISGTFPSIRFNNGGDKDKIRSVEEWGSSIAWEGMNYAFSGCSNLVNNATDTPDLSNITSLAQMFKDCTSLGNGSATNWGSWDTSNIIYMNNMFEGATSFNKNIGAWNVSNVEYMLFMFWKASSFNQNLNLWNVSKVENMNSMFREATVFNGNITGWITSEVLDMQQMFSSASAFNQNINNWNVSKVTNMSFMFSSASSFNQDLNSWNVSLVDDMSFMFYSTSFNGNISSWITSEVTDMSYMFSGNSAFNQNISNWNVSKVINMYRMFYNASSFNIDISSWVTSEVVNMADMFINASSFDQNLANWNVSKVTDMTNMFANITLSISNYEALLVGWNAQSLQSGVTFSGGNSKYNADVVAAAKANMIASDSWTITDGGRITEITWTGNTDTDWNTISNWNPSALPQSHNNVTIQNVINAPIINGTTGVVVNNLNVAEPDGITINTDGSLIVNGTSSGNITYKVNVPDDKWHLISSPVSGEQYHDTWNTTNSINVSGTGNNDAVATYDNTTDADGDWSYFQSGGASETFNQGQGYSLKRTGAGNYSFTGEFPVLNVLKTITIGNVGTGNENKWNLVGNPFPSYIRVSELITANAANLTDTHEFVYVWDNAENAGSGGYKTLVGSDYIHPGQAFFVNAANSNANNFTIAESLQSHQTGVTFYKNSNPSIKLFMNDGNNSKSTEIVYENNATTGLDKGFDAGTFTGTSTAFSIYSHLVSSSEGVDFMRQSLPKNNYENMVIPIGVNAYAEKEIIFSVNHQNLPNDLMVFIEDKENKTITRLDENNSSYKITLNSKNNGIGRFFLRTSTTDLRKTLDINDFNLDHISMYMSNERTLRVTGLIKSDYCIVNIYNIVGKQVLSRNKRTNSILDITMPSSIKQGIYIVKIETSKGNLVKKIFLK